MASYQWIIAALWLMFIAYWAIAASTAKPSIGAQWMWSRQMVLRLAIIVLVLVGLRILVFGHGSGNARLFLVNRNAVLGWIGAALCAFGFALAFWARAYLGRNWGMPMSRKEDPELVTRGPYAFVRHPIYAGMFLALLGSAIGVTIVWSVPLILGGIYFVYAARREERLLVEQFPDQYPAYQRRTKMLVPFLL